MTEPKPSRTIALAAVAIAIPVATWIALPFLPATGELPEPYSGGSSFPPSRLPFLTGKIGPAAQPGTPPEITNVQIIDFDEDGIMDVIACDAVAHQVIWYRQAPLGDYEARVLGEGLIDPAHATVVDLDQDGDRDVLVAVLGDVFPNDLRVGSVVLLENVGGAFQKRVLLGDLRRVADVQAGDLDGDLDLDIAVAVFGFTHGEVLWLENRGSLQIEPHRLHDAAGAIHVPLADYDGDGDLDIATVISQDDEEVYAFENLGGGRFQKRLLWRTFNFDLGSAGLVRVDLDQDGDMDLLLPAGDNLENSYSYPQPYHGCLWLENMGGWRFRPKRIATFGGTYAAAPGDLDGDGDLDVALVSMFNEWRMPGPASVVWLENDGRQNFTTWQIADRPTHLVTVACGDLDGDGRDDVVAGGLHIVAPYDRLGRITSWRSGLGR